MTRNTLIGGVLAGVLFLGNLGLADDPPKESSTASNGQTGSVEASKQPRIRLGGISLTGGYSRFSGPGYLGPPYFGYYDSPFWTPFWQTYFPFGGVGLSGFYPAYNFQRGPNMGEIKLQAEPVTASVFINDAYAGRVQDLRSMSLEPGVYNLRIETEGRPGFARRVYVLSGKTLKVEANLMAPKGEQQP
jgi:PEGA domain